MVKVMAVVCAPPVALICRVSVVLRRLLDKTMLSIRAPHALGSHNEPLMKHGRLFTLCDAVKWFAVMFARIVSVLRYYDNIEVRGELGTPFC